MKSPPGFRKFRVACGQKWALDAAMSDQKTLSGRAWAELLLLSLIWGGSFLAVKIALLQIGVFTIVANRVFWAMLVLWGFVVLRRLPVPKSAAIWGAFLVMGILNNVIPFSMVTWGQVYIESGLTSILIAATALFGILLAALFFKDERLTRAKLTGVLFGLIGVMLAIGPKAILGFDPRAMAQIVVLGGAGFYALAAIWARKTLSGLPGPVAAAGMLTGSSLIMVPLAIFVDGTPGLALSPATLGALGYISIIATAFAFLLYYRVLAMAGSGNLMLVTLFIPVVATTLGALVFHEHLSSLVWLGFSLIALGMIILDGRLLGRMRGRLSH